MYSPLMDAMIQFVVDEMQKSERQLLQIELFRDRIIIIGIRAGQTSQRKTLYYDLGVGVRTLPDVNHMLACATVIVRAWGSGFSLFPIQNKDSALIRPSIK